MRYKLFILLSFMFFGQGLAQSDYSPLFPADDTFRIRKTVYVATFNRSDIPTAMLSAFGLSPTETNRHTEERMTLLIRYLLASYYAVTLGINEPFLKGLQEVYNNRNGNLWIVLIYRCGIIYCMTKTLYRLASLYYRIPVPGLSGNDRQPAGTPLLTCAETGYRCNKPNHIRPTENDAAEALIVLAQYEMQKGELDLALERLKETRNILEPHTWWNNRHKNELWRDLFILLSDIYYRQSNYKEAYRLNALAYQYEDSINKAGNHSTCVKIYSQVEAEEQFIQLKQAEHESKQSIQRRNISLIVLAVSALLLTGLYKRSHRQHKKDREFFENRQQLLFREKEQSDQQLEDHIRILHEQSKKIEEYQTEIEQLRITPSGNDLRLQTIDIIEELRHFTIITDQSWTQFKVLFEKVHKGFFSRLKEKYPGITQAEIRLMALNKLNIPTKEMANMLGISPESIRKTGYRFQKKNSTAAGLSMAKIADSI